jgi:hypothetical protein
MDNFDFNDFEHDFVNDLLNSEIKNFDISIYKL